MKTSFTAIVICACLSLFITGCGKVSQSHSTTARANTSGAATQTTASPAADMPLPLKRGVAARKVKIEKTFSTKAAGVTGYLVSEHGKHAILYSTGGYLIVGAFIGPDGKNLSSSYLDEFVPKPDLSSLVKKMDAESKLFSLGPQSAPTLYVFADPNCIYCHLFYQATKPLVSAGKLRLRYAMVGFLKASSPGRASSILTSEDPVAAYAVDQDGFNVAHEQGGIKPMAHPPPEMIKLLQHNRSLMEQAGGHGTPTLLYLDTKGHWVVSDGMPSSKWLDQYAQRGAAP